MTKRKVLIPLDRTAYSLMILPQVEKFISTQETELILFHVTTKPAGIGVPVPRYEAELLDYVRVTPQRTMPHPIYASQEEEALQDEFEHELHAEVARLERAGYKVSSRVYFGDPADEILQALTDEKIDLVAMTTHAHEGLKKLFFGSVAEKVLHRVNIPVLLMHPS